MAQTNLNALLRVPGRLCLTPTDMTTSFPFGGTDLGLVEDIVARPGKETELLREETLGVTTKHGVDLGEAWRITAALRALEQGKAGTFFTTATGSVTGEQTIVHNPLANPPGLVAAPVSVMFCPFDELQQFFVWFPASVARPDVGAAMDKSIQRPGITLVGFHATPRSSDGLAAIKARKADLVLA